MQVTNVNDVRVYNLTCGQQAAPEWMDDTKKKKSKKEADAKQRIELIQGFEMPMLSNSISMTRDGQYIFVTGSYKPRVRCYDVNELSLKFERCFDHECIQMKILSEDYSKIVFMHANRYIEFHSQVGNYHTIRTPKQGRQFDYRYSSCDLYCVGATNEIYRFNLEQGQFLEPISSKSPGFNTCQFNPEHELFACGSVEGVLECYDPRARSSVGQIDCAVFANSNSGNSLPAISCLKFKDALNLSVGTSTGQILLFDIRSNKPYFIKDHNYNLPIKRIDFHTQNDDYILSIDKKICKIWNRHTGKNLTSMEPGTPLNDMLNIPGSGLICLTNDSPKIFVYYIPTLGNAPKWCTFLDNITEELEEKPADTVYDDYKFLTLKELDTLGLSHLIGSDLLRAYMHGYFMDIRLYNQAKTVAEPFAFAEYRKKKLRQKIDEKRERSRVPLPIVPTVNKDLAEKLRHDEGETTTKNKKKKAKNAEDKISASSVLKDSRFQSLFTNPDMQIDVNHDAFKNIAPLVSRLNKQTAVEEDVESMEEGDDDEDYDDREGNDEEVDLMDDILTSDEDEDEEKKAAVTPRRTKLVPVGAEDEGDQETLRSLSFSERARRTADSDKSSTFTRPSVANKIPTDNKEKRRKRNTDDDDDHRRNVRRAPRGRMNSRRGEP
ncbi:unnamed protein product [Adineta ricciae]|uniref:Nucleolar protein 10 n=1 Tax=Adineta ricciae TaxID=249248 RepID=A0A814ECX5_ADIRI|nr:unnamed protein product [Adineta ricciae]CAF0964710.1 unnamed protein product [Adineta ricciae]